MYLFDLTKINCSIYLIVKSLYYIIGLCNIKYFICDPVSVTKKIATFSSKNKTKYQCAHQCCNVHIDILFLLEKVAIFFCHRNRVANKIFNIAQPYYIIDTLKIFHCKKLNY